MLQSLSCGIFLKLPVKQFSIADGIKLANKFNDNCKNLEQKLDQLDRQIAQS